ncbi:unnamed protein product [Durusdinium trenchii]|uniref:Uncharacterized protein n=2 Tax=Durusdinium trenchii TaxID=1381693 RepID=A0ABP0PDJ6_9DINO
MTIDPQIMVQCVGAVVVYFAARMCHAAFVTSIDVWYSSPANRHLYFKAFKEKYQKTGKADYSALMRTHPETISQTFGDEATSEGQMVKAMVLPSTIIMAIGGIMMRCGGEDMWGFIFHAARGLMTPFGLLMVLQTPVVSGAGDGNREIREGRAVSNVELLYQLNWVILHFLGFAAFLGPVVLIELPVAIIELVNSEGFVGSFNDDGWLKNARMVLIIMRILCAVLLVVAAPFLGKSKTRNPNTLSALKWRAEFDVGEFGASQMYFNALSVWLQPGVGPYSTVSLVILALLALEAFRIFFCHAVYWLVVMCMWDSIDWSAQMKLSVPANGPVMQGLREVTNDELVFLHAVQAGVPDYTESIAKVPGYIPASKVATGCKYPPIKLLVLKAENYENFRALDIWDLAKDDVENWNQDLARVLGSLKSSDTLFIPCAGYKMDQQVPKMLLSLNDYEGDVEYLGVTPNEMTVPESDTDIALDLTSNFLGDPRCAFLTRGSFIEPLRAGALTDFYKVVAEIGLQIESSVKAVAKATDLDYESEEASDESDADAPLLTPYGSMAYEIQIRALRGPSPRMVLRMPKTQALPAGWQHLQRVEPFPASAK